MENYISRTVSLRNWLTSTNSGRLSTLVKYFFCGGVAAAFDIFFFAIFAKILGFNYILVSIIGFFIATFINYYLSIRIAFQSEVRFKKTKEVLMVYLISGLGQVIHIFLLFVFIEQFDIDKLIAKIFATGTVFIWNYLSRKLFVFARKKPI